MLNQLVLVGRLVEDPALKQLEDGREFANITIALQKPFKNSETDEYETDFIPVTLWQGIAANTCEFCGKGSIIGLKGRVSMRKIEVEGKSFKVPEIIAERITFISGQKK